MSVAVENPALFGTLSLGVSLVVTAISSWILMLKVLPPPLKGLLLCLVIAAPILATLAFYLFNLRHSQRAEIAVRARRHRDDLILRHVIISLKHFLQTVFDLETSQPMLHDKRLMESEREYARSRAHRIVRLLEQVARHFHLPLHLLEDCFCASSAALQVHSPQRVWLRYQIGLEAAHSALYRPVALSLDRYALRCHKRLTALRGLEDDLALVLRHVIGEASTGAALAASAAILSRHVAEGRFALVLALLDARHGVPMSALLEVTEDLIRDAGQASAATHYLASFSSHAQQCSVRVADQASRFIHDKEPMADTVITVGFSKLVAKVLRQWCEHRRASHLHPLTVIAVVPSEGDCEHADRPFEETRLMQAELAVDDCLEGRIVVARPDDLEELVVPSGSEPIVLMGAEMVTTSGWVAHPRGWRTIHEEIDWLLTRHRPRLRRYIVAESYKVKNLGEERLNTRSVTLFRPCEYQAILTDAGRTPDRSLSSIRGDWVYNINCWLKVSGQKSLLQP